MVVATMVVASVCGISAVRDMGYASANETLKRLCETGEKNLDDYFSSVEQSVEMVEAYIESDLDGADDARLQAHLDRVSEICERLMSKTDGVMTYYYRIDPAVSTNVGGFWYVRGEDGEFYPHEVTDITQYDTSDTSKLVWFTVPKENGKPVWLPPYITDNLGARVLSFNIPIYHEGTFVGVFGIDLEAALAADSAGDDYPPEVIALAAELGGYSGDDALEAVQALLDARAEARANKDWGTADAVRDGMAAIGFTIKDTPQGAQVEYAG